MTTAPQGQERASVRENLIRARALIDTPEKWAQGHYHTGGLHGFDRHCTLGAVEMYTPDYADRHAMKSALFDALPKADQRKPHCLATFNDTHTHSEVIAWWDRAIASQPLPTEDSAS